MTVDRIVSLVPAATETLFALGVGDRVRAVSHACDYPLEAAELPAASRTRIDPNGDAAAVDEAVRQSADAAEPVFDVLGEVLHHAQPDLVVTQAACEVCGITPVDVEAALARIEPVDPPEVLALHPHDLDDVVDGVRRLAETVDAAETGRALVSEMQRRIADVEAFAAERDEQPRVAALDWLDPPMAAGHWVPGMIERAGGRPTLVEDAAPSRYVDWDEVRAAEPETLLLLPCGFDAERASVEAGSLRAREGWRRLPAVERDRVFALDADAYTSRPGPRLVDGLEQVACALHGDAARERWPEQAARVRRVAGSAPSADA